MKEKIVTFVTQLSRLVGLGNCDAATALALFGGEAGIDRLILANPWLIEPIDDLPPAAAIRSHYLRRLINPMTYIQFLRGAVNVRKLLRGLRRAARGDAPAPLIDQLHDSLIARDPRPTVILAERDPTAIAFRAAINLRACGITPVVISTNSHSFARAADAAAFEQAVIAAIA